MKKNLKVKRLLSNNFVDKYIIYIFAVQEITKFTNYTNYINRITMRQTYFIKCLVSLVMMLTSTMAWAQEEITDELTASDFPATSTQYKSFSNVKKTSTAEYAGCSAKSNGGIQLNNNKHNPGIVSTTSGGKVKSITITVKDNNKKNTIDVYGKHSAYKSATDLYAKEDVAIQGKKIGSTNETKTITVAGDYEYIGIRPTKGAVYITSIKIVWEVPSSGKTATTVAFAEGSKANYDVILGEAFTAPKATVTSTGAGFTGNVTYSSNKPEVATVNEATGDVEIKTVGTATITASYAGTENYASSSASYTLNVGCANLKDANAKATETEVPVFIKLTNAIITGVNDSKAYISDGEFGLLILYSNHGLKEGDVLNGNIKGKLKLFKDAPDLTDIDLTGVVKTTGELKPTETTIDKISKANIGRYVVVKNLTYTSASKEFSDGEKSIAFYDGLNKGITLTDATVYNVTGVVGYYHEPQLYPTVVEEVGSMPKPTLSTSTEPQKSLVIGTNDTYKITYDGDGVVSVRSSAEEVAKASYDSASKTVTITPVASGSTTITISTTVGKQYAAADPIIYELNVTEAGKEVVTFNYNDEGINNKGTSGGGKGFYVAKGNVTLEFDNAYGATKHIKVYGKANITVKATEGYAVKQIDLEGIKGKLQTWKDQNGTYVASEGTTTATWTGMLPYVILSNQGSSQAQILKIIVTLQKLDEAGTVEIGEIGKATYNTTACVIVGNGTIAKYLTGVNGVTLIEKDAPVVASGEGVMLIGNPGSYTLYTHSSLAPEKNVENKLVGCATETSVPVDCYVLQKNNEKTAFYKVVVADPITCPAGKAYLNLGSSSSAKALFFGGDETTEINTVDDNKVSLDDDIYTVTGVKVDAKNLTKGIYVVKGRTFIVK